MAHHVCCAQPVAPNCASLVPAGESAWQHTQQWQPVRPAALVRGRQCQQHPRDATQKLHSCRAVSSCKPHSSDFTSLFQKKNQTKVRQFGQRRPQETKCQIVTGQESVESDVLGRQLVREGESSQRRAIGRSILRGLPVAAVFWASEIARAAEETEQPLIISNEDELSNKIIAVFFTLGVIALTILTAGVIYLSLSDFKEKREAAKMEALERRAPKKPLAKPVESKAFSRGRKTFDLLDDINNEEQRKS